MINKTQKDIPFYSIYKMSYEKQHQGRCVMFYWHFSIRDTFYWHVILTVGPLSVGQQLSNSHPKDVQQLKQKGWQLANSQPSNGQ